MISKTYFKIADISARFPRHFSLSARQHGLKERYESYIQLQTLLQSQENVLRASEDYSTVRKERVQTVGSLISEQNRLRDIHSEMDMVTSSHPTFPSLLQSEINALNSMHSCLFDVNQHDRRDHNYYLDLKSALQNNFEAEHQSERKARQAFLGGILAGVGCGILFAFLASHTINYLKKDHSGDSLLASYAASDSVDEFNRWIRRQHVKMNVLLNEIAKDLHIERSGDALAGSGERDLGESKEECWEGDRMFERVAEMKRRNKKFQEEMKVLTEAVKMNSLPVLEMNEGGGRGETGLWLTTFSYSCAAIFVPLLAYMAM